jgi:hypothetical protein
MNTKLLRKVAKAMLKHYKNVHMARWVDHTDTEAPCGTTGCVAGWIVAEGDLKKLRKLDATFNWEDTAAEMLGVSVYRARKLFHVENWPKKFRGAYFESNTRKLDTEITVQRMKHFMQL